MTNQNPTQKNTVSLNPTEKKRVRRMLLDRADEILEMFDVKCFGGDSRFIGCCPIHEGDNESAFNLNVDESSKYYGRWFCNTRSCHDEYGGDIIGLIHALMDRDGDASFDDVLRFCEQFLGGVPVCEHDASLFTKDHFVELFQKKENAATAKCTRRDALSRLLIPCTRYAEMKNFSRQTLRHFNIGLCLDKNSKVYKRAVFPVWSENGENMVGCTARSLIDEPLARKWINSKGFDKTLSLYNYFEAYKHIKREGSVILVEGQGDVLRLYENGVRNVVGMFGSHLSDRQAELLERTPAQKLILMTDMDEAGFRCRSQIIDKTRRLYEIQEVSFPSEDVGSMSNNQIQEYILPQIKREQ